MLADSGPALQLSPEITYWSFAQSFSLPQEKKKSSALRVRRVREMKCHGFPQQVNLDVSTSPQFTSLLLGNCLRSLTDIFEVMCNDLMRNDVFLQSRASLFDLHIFIYIYLFIKICSKIFCKFKNLLHFNFDNQDIYCKCRTIMCAQ